GTRRKPIHGGSVAASMPLTVPARALYCPWTIPGASFALRPLNQEEQKARAKAWVSNNIR
ncbi:hypothetical protein, partial [Stenotrophomonas maltophilia]|uniref:hypothetical protein n=1 Tax=Stenotrophomonas maltophilia TaxID=40324 RepID=UPI00195526B7